MVWCLPCIDCGPTLCCVMRLCCSAPSTTGAVHPLSPLSGRPSKVKSPASSSSAPVHRDVFDYISSLSVVALRAALADAKISSSDCVEKAELRDRLVSAIAAGYQLDVGKYGRASTSSSASSMTSSASTPHGRGRARSAAPSPRAAAAAPSSAVGTADGADRGTVTVV